MTPDQFLDRCKFVCHVGPVGVWEQIAKHGFRTAEQLILESDLSEDEQQRLLSTPRRESIRLSVAGDEVLLRDQGPLFARKDLASILGEGLDVSDWVRHLRDDQNVITFVASNSGPSKALPDQYHRAFAQAVLDAVKPPLLKDSAYLMNDFRDVVIERVLKLTERQQQAACYLPESINGQFPILNPQPAGR